jgi:hypothetical protein
LDAVLRFTAASTEVRWLAATSRVRQCGIHWRGVNALVYAVEQSQRHVYCSSPQCIAALVKMGWRLSDPEQLTELVRELATAPAGKTHEPTDHLH